ncbi:DNA-binding Lrp family transcriptional regulator [Conyzicola lurida]|uniref:DNA-binding Lrp family transcriptional regulator n=1 Tax=Conyzicola lurida TaxID=1172621 RepID=A0A841ATU8_9MICO|nr:Lrp/AsnC family transcriptional regulator [Conyzicola lurida]MBB5844829.1 DNA-binding Lrp family transcriptional regulator [Conyzicola lurida]
MPNIDATDARILLALDDEPEATTLSLSRALGIARNTVHARLRKLVERDLLGSPSQRVNPASLGYGLTAFLRLSITQSNADARIAALTAIPEIVEILAITGEGDLQARVVARDPAHLYRLTTGILEIDGVTRSSTALAMAEIVPNRMRPLLERHAR